MERKLCWGVAQVNKRKGEEYKLLWKDSPEFVRLATKCNALIVPFAAVGGVCARPSLQRPSYQPRSEVTHNQHLP